MSDAFNERLRLIRFRRRRERSRFRDELRIIPKWLIWMCVSLYIVALVVGMAVNIHGFQTHGAIFPADEPSAMSRPCHAWLSPGSSPRWLLCFLACCSCSATCIATLSVVACIRPCGRCWF